jgi:GTP-binding protein HflX
MGQIDAVRTVLSQIGAADVPEQLVVNKIDRVSPQTLEELRLALPESVQVSAHTGDGIDALRQLIEDRLPVPGVPVDLVVPWTRGDLVDKVHRMGELHSSDNLAEGTHIVAHVPGGLAAELQEAASGNG